jgi:hypothetical protein
MYRPFGLGAPDKGILDQETEPSDMSDMSDMSEESEESTEDGESYD